MKEEFIYENIRIIDVIAMQNKYLIFLLEQMFQNISDKYINRLS